MKKISSTLLISLTTLCSFLFFSCKKSSADTTATTTTVLTAIINGVTWSPDTLSANINYNATAKTKTFSFSGTIAQKRLTGSVVLTNAASANTFTTGAFAVDATGTTNMLYSVQQKDSNGNYVFVPFVAATSGDGYITISSIDNVSNTITGTFYFTHKSTNYDANGSVTSISNNVISGGVFTSMPYTFTTN